MNNPLIQKYGKEKRFVNWRLLKVNGRATKIPYQITGRPASSIDPLTWSTYEDSKEASDKAGIVLHDKKLIGIDVDHVIVDGKIEHDKKEMITDLLLEADSYTEISQSGTGLHIFLALTEPMELEANRHEPFEVYVTGRYIALTENCYGEPKEVRTVTPDECLKILKIMGYPWDKAKKNESVQTKVDNLSINDSSLLEKMFESKNGNKIKALYNGDLSAFGEDASRADMALVSCLAFWTGKNSQLMESVWLSSPLGSREKTLARKDYRVRTIEAAIKNCSEVYTPPKPTKKDKNSGGKKEGESHVDILLRIVGSKESTILFHDEKGDSYVSLENKGHQEIWGCKTKYVSRWLGNEFWNEENSAPSSEAMKTVIRSIDSRASYAGPLHKLNNRFAWDKSDLWYDLTNENWQAVKINREGWDVVDSPPILFKRYTHNQSQILPARDGGDVSLLLKYVNITDPQHKLLLQVFLVSSFIPDIAHVILVVFGSQGSAKSTLSKLLRIIIDPSIIDVVSMPDNVKELVQTLAHHAFLFFDNVSYISEIISDILCKVSTGSSFSKRELYSDDEDIIYTLKRSIGINGINLVGTRPDLLERSLLLELERIEPENRKQEKELMDSFEKDLPLILGGVFDVLVEALKTKENIKIKNLPRMADFAVWGCAIAEALGHTQAEFMNAYRSNIDSQTEIILNENIVAATVISFLNDKDEWSGTASDLLNALNNQASFDDVNKYEKYWPKASNILMRRLKELKVSLKQAGILFESVSNGATRVVTLKKILAIKKEEPILQPISQNPLIVDSPVKVETDATDDNI